MVDTVTTTANINDDWEVAVDTGEFDKRLEQHEKARAAYQEPAVSTTVNDDDSQTSSSINLMKSNKPIRILKRPTSQSKLSTNNDVINSSATTAPTSTTALNNVHINNISTILSNNISASTAVPVISIIPRNQANDSTNSSQSLNIPSFANTSTTSQSTKPPIKTYEQREIEYRLARLRIMGEEESSVKDDDEDVTTAEPTTGSVDELNKATISSSSSSAVSSSTRTTNKMTGLSHPQPLQCHSTPGSYASNLYALNNAPSNTGAIHFTPNTNSTPTLGTGPFSSPNFPQHYRAPYSAPYSHMPPPPSASVPRYPSPVATTATLYMTSTAPFISAPSSSSSSSSSYHYQPQQHPNMTTTNWYHYPQQQAPYGTQQYGHPQ